VARDQPTVLTHQRRARPAPLLDAGGYRGDLGVRVGARVLRIRDQPLDRPPLDLVRRPRPLISVAISRAGARAPREGGSLRSRGIRGRFSTVRCRFAGPIDRFGGARLVFRYRPNGRFPATRARQSGLTLLWLASARAGFGGGFRQFDADLPAPHDGRAPARVEGGPRRPDLQHSNRGLSLDAPSRARVGGDLVGRDLGLPEDAPSRAHVWADGKCHLDKPQANRGA
jgi:hypothetical protein